MTIEASPVAVPMPSANGQLHAGTNPVTGVRISRKDANLANATPEQRLDYDRLERIDELKKTLHSPNVSEHDRAGLLAEQRQLLAEHKAAHPEQLDQELKQQADWEYMQLQARQIARDRLAAANTRPLPQPEDATALEVTPTTWVVRDYLELGTIGLLCGKYGTAKSFLALDWACCSATGREWLDHATQKAKVLYVAAEGGAGQAKRFKAWVQEHQDVEKDAVIFLRGPINIASDAGRKHIIEMIKQYETTLLIIDTLARSSGGLNEDSSTEMRPFISALYEFRDVLGETETTVLVVHHFGKDTSRGARGTSTLASDVDFNYELTKDKITGCITLHCDKLKEASEPPDLGLRLRTVPLAEHWGETSCVLQGVELATDDDQLVSYINQHPGMGSGAIATARGSNRQNMSARLSRLAREGRILDQDRRQNRTSWIVGDTYEGMEDCMTDYDLDREEDPFDEEIGEDGPPPGAKHRYSLHPKHRDHNLTVAHDSQ